MSKILSDESFDILEAVRDLLEDTPHEEVFKKEEQHGDQNTEVVPSPLKFIRKRDIGKMLLPNQQAESRNFQEVLFYEYIERTNLLKDAEENIAKKRSIEETDTATLSDPCFEAQFFKNLEDLAQTIGMEKVVLLDDEPKVKKDDSKPKQKKFPK